MSEKRITKTVNKIKKQEMKDEVKHYKSLVDLEKAKRQVLREYVKSQLLEGVDFGKIKIKGRNGREYESKPTLFKAGSEKIMSLLNLDPKFTKDTETWEMVGSKAGEICFKCDLYFKKNEKWAGEGRGAASVESEGTINKAVKMAEKRAQLDAILRASGLSDVFTQDLEDQSERGNIEKGNRLTGKSRPTYTGKEKATAGQIKFIYTLLSQNKKSKDPILEFFKVKSMNDLTFTQASKTINQLTGKGKKKAESEPDQSENTEVISDEELEDISSKIDG
jgi:hypothetical protein